MIYTLPVLNTVPRLNRNGTSSLADTSLNTPPKQLKSNVDSMASCLKVGKPFSLVSLLLMRLLPLVSYPKVSLLPFPKLSLNFWVDLPI